MDKKTVSPDKVAAGFCLILLSTPLPCQAVTSEPSFSPSELTELPLEKLMDIEVTSVAKKPQKLSEAAAAIYVITQEDIRRSGMTSIPELLRTVPGLDVAQFDANKWAISSRGFNDLFANKLLVLIDGRAVYTPDFSGVFWDVQDMLLEDIDRIEVIRGPGGTLWGANAVNGVINIITKNAKDTQGGLLMAEKGNIEDDLEGFRYGGALGKLGYFRVYGKHFDRDKFQNATGADASDQWNQQRGGFRVDLTPQSGDVLTLQGDAYSGESGQTIIEPSLASPFVTSFGDSVNVDGRYLLAKWQRAVNGGDMSLQAYYDHYNRESATLSGLRNTYDLDFQYRTPWGGRHELIWGLGYRRTDDEITSTTSLEFFSPPSKSLNLYSAFLQDESAWWGNRLHFILGSKFEHNDFTGFEYQPNVRLLWKTSEEGALWAAVSRAVRTPSRGDTAVNFAVTATPTGLPPPFPPAALATILGNPDLDSERLIAYEIGFRDKLRENLSFDWTAFYNDYDRLVTHEAGTPFLDNSLLPTHLVIPLLSENKAHGHVWGTELTANWRVTERWRLNGSFSLLRMHLQADADSNDVTTSQVAGNNPRQQWQLHSYLDLPADLSLDAAFYYVSSLTSQNVPSYTRMDVRLGWQPIKALELSVVGQNLFDDRHLEFVNSPAQLGSEIPRGVFVRALWHF